MIEELRALVSQFQKETHSISVLDFIVWIENRDMYIKKIISQDPRIIGKKIANELLKKEEK